MAAMGSGRGRWAALEAMAAGGGPEGLVHLGIGATAVPFLAGVLAAMAAATQGGGSGSNTAAGAAAGGGGGGGGGGSGSRVATGATAKGSAVAFATSSATSPAHTARAAAEGQRLEQALATWFAAMLAAVMCLGGGGTGHNLVFAGLGVTFDAGAGAPGSWFIV